MRPAFANPIARRRSVVGLAVDSSHVRAVAVSGDVVLWAAEADRSATDAEAGPLVEALAALLADARRRTAGRPFVVATIGPAASQVKTITGLPALDDPIALANVIREGAGRFFLKNGIPLVTTGVQSVGTGAVLAAAIDEPIVRDIAEACRRAGLTLRGVLPAVVAIAGVVRSDRFEWADGDVVAEVELAPGGIRRVRRRRLLGTDAHASDEGKATPAIEALNAIAPDGWRFADAYGASRLSGDEALSVDPRSLTTSGANSRRHRLAPLVACGLALGSALAAPGLAARQQAAEHTDRLALLGPSRRQAIEVERDLRLVDASLQEVERFERARSSSLFRLRDLAAALPPTAALVSARFDSAGATLVVVARHASDVRTRLESLSWVTAPEITGPIVREVVGGRELERATIRLGTTTEADTDDSSRAVGQTTR